MTRQERKDAEIIKAAKHCKDGKPCFVCKYAKYFNCRTLLLDKLSDVIDRKDKRIKELEERIAIMTETTTPDYDGQNIYCNECRTLIASTDKYCRECGRLVVWE